MRFLIIVLLFSVGFLAKSQESIILRSSELSSNLGGNMSVFMDSSSALSFTEVSKRDFELCKDGVPNFGVSDITYWVRFELQNGDIQGQVLIDVSQPNLDEVTFFCPIGSFCDSIVLSDKVPVADRLIQNQDYVFPLDLNVSASQICYLKIHSGDQVQLPIYIGSKDQIMDKLSEKDSLFSLYTGILFMMFITGMLLFFKTKDKIYVLYVAYILIVFITQANFQGYTLRYLWKDYPFFERYSVYFLSALVGIIGSIFIMNYIQVSKNARWSLKYFYSIFTIYPFVVLLAVSGYFNIAYNVLQAIASFSAILVIVVTYKISKTGNPQASNLLVAWSVFMMGIIVFVLKDLGIIPYNVFTYNAMTIGSAIEGTLLSFGLADKINQLKHEKERSQERMILVMQENQALITDQNSRLERMVNDRTQDLEKANYELNSTLRNLKVTQKQLVESEKLASLGQMTAGIAHEINNPINFVSSNIQPLKRDVKDILYLLDEYASAGNAEALMAKLPELQKKYKDLDIEFLKKEIEMLLSGIEEGSRRTAEIVKGLRIFSRMDRDTLVSANINECINSTLVVMKSLTKGEVTIVKEYSDNLPSLDCFPGKLNQVFMNILTNAVQATKMEGRMAPDRKIEIKTSCDDNNVIVCITDNGAGMDEAVKAKIFDPFFTTKSVGEGTGLGLSIAMGIVSEHNGKIEVNSQVGKGTEFLITLPRLQSITSKAA